MNKTIYKNGSSHMPITIKEAKEFILDDINKT